jgi:hypothetical protein
MKAKICIIPGLFLLLANMDLSRAQIVYGPPQKKLIDFGWHSPFIQEYIKNMPVYEKRPFDGVTLKISKDACGGNIFMVDNWEKITNEAKESEMIRASSVKKSTILTDNFMVLYGASQMDWFSDEDWARVEDHMRYAVKLARAANCKGILWDPEPYKPGKNPWKFNEQEKTGQYSFEQYNTQLRKRGSQFIKILQEEFPGIIIFSLRELSDWQQGSPFSTPLLPVVNRENTINELKDAWWGLHAAFYTGMIEAIQPGTVFIDGNEEAYFYTSALEFYAVRHTLTDDAKALIPPELWSKHSCFNRIGHAIAAEYIAGNWLGMKPFPYRLTGQGLMMTPKEKAMWFEHNAYYALRTADEYTWLYTEGMNLWTGEKVPEGFLEALLRAKNKVAAGQPLGFEIDLMIQNAQDKAEEFYKDK